MAIRLSIESGALAGTEIVTASKTVRLGRNPENNDLVLLHPDVSRRHAILTASVRGGYALEVIGTGPTQLNGEVVMPTAAGPATVPLTSGDRFMLGAIGIRFSETTAKLIVTAGPAVGRELILTGDAQVGRGGDSSLVVDDAQVFASHFTVEASPLGFRLVPHARTWINGKESELRVLSHGDEIVIGGSTLRFAADGGEGADNGEQWQDASPQQAAIKTGGAPAASAVGDMVFVAGQAKDARIPLGDEQIILGTRDDCTYAVNDAQVAAVHLAISKNGDEFVVTDLASETGTYVNGNRITQGTALRPGDLVAFGSHVLEARLRGGVRQAQKLKTVFATVIAELPVEQQAQPKFVIDGRVINAARILIGRSPKAEMSIDAPGVSREHCAIEWDDGFTVRDTSNFGTYLDDKRIVSQLLPPSSVLRVGDALIRVSVRGELCTLEVADALLAQAAVDVARVQANQDAKKFAGNLGGGGGEALKTMFRMEAGAVEQQIAARKRDLRKGAPVWRPSSDIQRSNVTRGAIALSVLTSLAICAATIFIGHGDALVNHPLSGAHSSKAFAAQASAKGLTVCGACHVAGNKIAATSCTGCHTGFEAHLAPHTFACARCHLEHRNAPLSKKDAPGYLAARQECVGCHVDQHKKEFADRVGAPQILAAGSLPDTQLDVGALHAAHSLVKTADGKTGVGVACRACHGTEVAGTPGAAAGGVAAAGSGTMTEAKPRLACFRCHDGGAQASTSGCERCHGSMHPGVAPMPRLESTSPMMAAAAPAPNPAKSLLWAALLAVMVSVPMGGLAFARRTQRHARQLALVEELKAHPAEVVKRLVHSINDSKCVGCGMCVQACPASVLDLVDHKSRVLNFDSCIQCKRCENACAFDALRMHDADKPPPMISMPSVDAFHETPVPGLFLIGQASGVPQVKNATNLGRAAVQRILQVGYKPGAGATLGADYDVVIVGSGPAGLSAAVTCIEFGLTYVLLEKERQLSWTIRNYYHKGKEVMAEPHDIALEASLPHWDSSREELLGAWEKMAAESNMDIRYQHPVADVKKTGEVFTVSCGDPKNVTATFTAGRVVLAIGTLGQPRTLGCAGENLEKVKNSLVDPDEWSGKNVLVVGGSDSAVEVVLALAKVERNNKLWYSVRGAKLEGIKPKNRQLIEAVIAAGRVTMLYATAVDGVTETTAAVKYKDDNRREEFPNDVVFGMIGGNPPQKWLQGLGVPYVEKPHSWSPPRTDLLSAKTAEGLVPLRRLLAVIPAKKAGGHH